MRVRRRLRANSAAPTATDSAPRPVRLLDVLPVNGSRTPVGLGVATVVPKWCTTVVDVDVDVDVVVEVDSDVVVVDPATCTVVEVVVSGAVVVVVSATVVVVVSATVVVVLDGGSSRIVTSFEPVAATVACDCANSARNAKRCGPGVRPVNTAEVADGGDVERFPVGLFAQVIGRDRVARTRHRGRPGDGGVGAVTDRGDAGRGAVRDDRAARLAADRSARRIARRGSRQAGSG